MNPPTTAKLREAAAPAMLAALRLVEGNIASLVAAYPERYRMVDWQSTLDAARALLDGAA